MKIKPTQRLGAFGLTAALTLLGGGALMGTCAPPPPPPPPLVLEVLPVQSQLVASVNAFRAQYGIPPVAENALLDAAAQDHSADQAGNQKMSHTGSTGSTPAQRIAATGYVAYIWAENVAAGQKDVTSVMTAWMNSSGHRANILDARLTQIGVAAVRGTNGVIYWTMDLATPK